SALDFCPGDVALDTEQPLTKLIIGARLHAAEETGGVGGDCRGKQAEAYAAVVGQVDRAVAPGIAAVQPGIEPCPTVGDGDGWRLIWERGRHVGGDGRATADQNEGGDACLHEPVHDAPSFDRVNTWRRPVRRTGS